MSPRSRQVAGGALCLADRLATWYRGRAARKVRHLAAEEGPGPTDQESTAMSEARPRTRRTPAGEAIILPPLILALKDRSSRAPDSSFR